MRQSKVILFRLQPCKRLQDAPLHISRYALSHVLLCWQMYAIHLLIAARSSITRYVHDCYARSSYVHPLPLRHGQHITRWYNYYFLYPPPSPRPSLLLLVLLLLSLFGCVGASRILRTSSRVTVRVLLVLCSFVVGSSMCDVLGNQRCRDGLHRWLLSAVRSSCC
jgi:hypothetical protein